MLALSSLADATQTAGVILAAVLAGVVLLTPSARARASAMLAALVLTPVLLVANIWSTSQFHPLRDHPALGAGAAIAALAAVAVVAVVIHRRPTLLALGATAMLPFRIPIESGGDTTNLLVGLYLVIGAGVLAYAVPRLRGGAPEGWAEHRRGNVEWALAGTVVLYAVQSAYSGDFNPALQQVVFFYVPFSLLFALLVRLPWSGALVARCLGVALALAVAFVAVGFVEYSSRRLLLNPKVISSNQLETYFRVNSLFFDPNIYGRFLVIVMIGVVAIVLFDERVRTSAAGVLVLALLWAGLVLTLSQSSFTALLGGLAVLGAMRWSLRRAAVIAGVLAVAGAVVVIATPGTVGLDQSTSDATSGRSVLVTGGLDLFADRPLQGWGAGDFRHEYRQRKNTSNRRATNASHTTPITIAAEQGIPGLIVYLVLLATALGTLLPRSASSVARAGVAAAFVALIVHTMLYASFLEDPMSWTLLAVGVALAGAAAPRKRPARRRAPAST